VYALDWLYLFNAFLAGIVLLGVAKTVPVTAPSFSSLQLPASSLVDPASLPTRCPPHPSTSPHPHPQATSIIAKWFYYDRATCKMIRNKSMERLAVGTRLAELGVKAAAYSAIFNNLDDDSDGYIDVKDLVKSLKNTQYSMADSKLHAIASLVIKRSSLLLNQRDEEPDRMDYAEFMACMEGGAALPIEQFTGMVASPARWASWNMPKLLYYSAMSPARKKSAAGSMAGVERFEAEGEGRRLA